MSGEFELLLQTVKGPPGVTTADTGTGFTVIEILFVALHPLGTVTVTVYIPEAVTLYSC